MTERRIRGTRWPRPRLWAGWKPYGIGEQKPNHFLEMARTAWENRHHPRYAWRILRHGVCDGCALGAAGFRDWTIEGVHLCTTRLNLLKVNTMGALDPAVLADVAALRDYSAADLRGLGRLPVPMRRRRGERGFRPITWDEALDSIAKRIRATGDRDRIGFFLTSRGITNEVYYVAGKVARFLGTNNVDNAARICHAPSTGALKSSIGAAATTVSYADVIRSRLVVLWGSNAANAQPVFMKYLYLARKDGTQVAVVNPYREPGLTRYWVPSNLESMLFGTRIAPDANYFGLRTGGDIAFINGVLKALIAAGGVDDAFVREHTTGWADLRAALEATSYDDLERWSGSTRADMERFARLYASAESAVFVWSMGITQHVCGTDNVLAIVNLALARGNVGRPGAGLMPIRGHSGVQGGAEMGAYATAFPGGLPVNPTNAAALADAWGFPIRGERGMSATEMLEAALAGDMDVLYSSGGNFLETLPDPSAVRQALESVPLRVHQDIVVSTQMLVDPGDEVILLPAMTRYEQPGGGTETTTERRIVFSPEIPGPRIGEARAEWQVFAELAARVDPARADLVRFDSAQAIREEIARVVPLYKGIEDLRRSGDQVQWGGERLCDGWQFPTADGRAHFTPIQPPETALAPGHFLLSTRRGKQFNSMVWKEKDPLTGARRDAIFVSPEDAAALRLADGDALVVRSETGAELLATAHLSEIRSGNVQMFFPEANALLPSGRRDPVSHVPDYNAIVELVPRTDPRGAPRP